jgi:hypothetical protein
MSTMRSILLALAAAAAALALPVTAGAATFKWVDEKGVVHYSDKMPPDAVEKGSVELNKQGIPVKRTDPAPTLEQRRAKQAEEERQLQVAREREVVDRRDRALMQSYTTDSEIDLARHRALGTIDSQLQSAQAYSVQLAKRRAELDAKRKAYGSKPVPPAIDSELESIASELAKQDALIAEKKRETAAVSARYDADKLRWRELRAISDAKEGLAAPPARAGTAQAGSPRQGATAAASAGKQ